VAWLLEDTHLSSPELNFISALFHFFSFICEKVPAERDIFSNFE
jgi:hypothetical protein